MAVDQVRPDERVLPMIVLRRVLRSCRRSRRCSAASALRVCNWSASESLRHLCPRTTPLGEKAAQGCGRENTEKKPTLCRMRRNGQIVRECLNGGDARLERSAGGGYEFIKPLEKQNGEQRAKQARISKTAPGPGTLDFGKRATYASRLPQLA